MLINSSCNENDFKSNPGGELGETTEIILENIGLPGNVPTWVEPRHKIEAFSKLGPKIESVHRLTDILWTLEPENCYTRSPFSLMKIGSTQFVFKFTGKVYLADQIWISDLDTFQTKRIKYSDVEWIND